jgi:pimeloyl-ACP methyl ester carboxylesterase
MSNTKEIVFIHGAGLGSFIWNDVKAHLKYPSLATDFPNRNKGDKANRKLHFDDYCKSVIEQAEKVKTSQLVLVTHSIGGCVGLKVAEHFGSRVAGFAAITAVIPENGRSFVSCMPFPLKIIMPALLKIAGTKPPQKAISKRLCKDLSAGQCKMVVENFTAEARNLYTENCKAKIPPVRTLFIKTLDDRELPVALQEKMARNLKAQKINSLESGHLPMLSQPKKLAELLNRFCDEI